ncbi:MAG: hypothetical protein V1787_03900 [Candidatus Micrarchaeota archaeon]
MENVRPWADKFGSYLRTRKIDFEAAGRRLTIPEQSVARMILVSVKLPPGREEPGEVMSRMDRHEYLLVRMLRHGLGSDLKKLHLAVYSRVEKGRLVGVHVEESKLRTKGANH